jgi:regulatory protein YycH of two-component signal transduction system YycFG
MKERFKSIILIVLVCSSLILTYQLWYGQQPAELTADEDIYERVIIEQPRPPEQIVFPETIVIPIESGYYALREGEQLYYRFWETLIEQLHRAFASNPAGTGSGFPEEAPLLLSCYLKPLLPVGSESSLLPLLPESELARLDLRAGSDSDWVRLFTAEGEVLAEVQLSSAQTAELKELIAVAIAEERVLHDLLTGETADLASAQTVLVSGVIFLPREQIALARIPVKPEAINREQLLKTFFVDSSLARSIEEKDGAVIYTDGERGLRLTTGGFEYSYPRLEEGEVSQTVAEALNSSGSLISYHGGWPPGLRLEKIEQTRLGRSVTYSTQWRMYYLGYPLYAAKPTRIVFNDRGLIHFNRLIYNIQNQNQDQAEVRMTAKWQEALRAALEIYAAETGAQPEVLKLEAFNLGYAIVAGVNELWAEPVWHLQLEDRRILLRADSLVQIQVEDLR